MEEARRIDRTASITVRYMEAAAEHTGFPEASFDLVIAGQWWFWFDRPRAASEARRIVKSGGHLVIAHFDWIPLPGNVADLTEKLIEKHNPKWKLGGSVGIHSRCLADVASAGFRRLETFSFDLDVPYSHEAWRRSTETCRRCSRKNFRKSRSRCCIASSPRSAKRRSENRSHLIVKKTFSCRRDERPPSPALGGGQGFLQRLPVGHLR